ncbi:MAG: hypothetical protein WA057_05820 [Candidatus Magasanikiibacteriota bacterium]
MSFKEFKNFFQSPKGIKRDERITASVKGFFDDRKQTKGMVDAYEFDRKEKERNDAEASKMVTSRRFQNKGENIDEGESEVHSAVEYPGKWEMLKDRLVGGNRQEPVADFLEAEARAEAKIHKRRVQDWIEGSEDGSVKGIRQIIEEQNLDIDLEFVLEKINQKEKDWGTHYEQFIRDIFSMVAEMKVMIYQENLVRWMTDLVETEGFDIEVDLDGILGKLNQAINRSGGDFSKVNSELQETEREIKIEVKRQMLSGWLDKFLAPSEQCKTEKDTAVNGVEEDLKIELEKVDGLSKATSEVNKLVQKQDALELRKRILSEEMLKLERLEQESEVGAEVEGGEVEVVVEGGGRKKGKKGKKVETAGNASTIEERKARVQKAIDEYEDELKLARAELALSREKLATITTQAGGSAEKVRVLKERKKQLQGEQKSAEDELKKVKGVIETFRQDINTQAKSSGSNESSFRLEIARIKRKASNDLDKLGGIKDFPDLDNIPEMPKLDLPELPDEFCYLPSDVQSKLSKKKPVDVKKPWELTGPMAPSGIFRAASGGKISPFRKERGGETEKSDKDRLREILAGNNLEKKIQALVKWAEEKNRRQGLGDESDEYSALSLLLRAESFVNGLSDNDKKVEWLKTIGTWINMPERDKQNYDALSDTDRAIINDLEINYNPQTGKPELFRKDDLDRLEQQIENESDPEKKLILLLKKAQYEAMGLLEGDFNKTLELVSQELEKIKDNCARFISLACLVAERRNNLGADDGETKRILGTAVEMTEKVEDLTEREKLIKKLIKSYGALGPRKEAIDHLVGDTSEPISEPVEESVETEELDEDAPVVDEQSTRTEDFVGFDYDEVFTDDEAASQVDEDVDSQTVPNQDKSKDVAKLAWLKNLGKRLVPSFLKRNQEKVEPNQTGPDVQEPEQESESDQEFNKLLESMEGDHVNIKLKSLAEFVQDQESKGTFGSISDRVKDMVGGLSQELNKRGERSSENTMGAYIDLARVNTALNNFTEARKNYDKSRKMGPSIITKGPGYYQDSHLDQTFKWLDAMIDGYIKLGPTSRAKSRAKNCYKEMAKLRGYVRKAEKKYRGDPDKQPFGNHLYEDINARMEGYVHQINKK